MPQFVAFLRGINLGKRRIRMEDLRAAFAKMGFADTRTLIASGNVLFTTDATDDLAGTIETGLQEAFGFKVPTILRAVTELKALAALDPFADHPETENSKRYVFFLSRPEVGAHAFAYSVAGDYDIVRTTEREIFAVAYRMENGRFGEGLDQLAKPFRDGITNRNWNTVQRMIEKARS